MTQVAVTEPVGIGWSFLRFSLHIAVAVGLFAVLAAAAVFTDYVMRVLTYREIDGLIVSGFKGLKYFLFVVDLVLFPRCVLKASLRLYREL